MHSCVVPHYRPCHLVKSITISYACWCVALLKSNAFWCSASLLTMPVGVLPHYMPCLMVWCLIISHAFWCGGSLWSMLSGVMPHARIISLACWCGSFYRPCLLSCTSLYAMPAGQSPLQPTFYQSNADGRRMVTCTEVPLYQTCLLIRRLSQICLLVQCNSIRQARWVY